MLKLREEADPFSMDLGVLHAGEVVKVLEVSTASDGNVCYVCPGGWGGGGGISACLCHYHITSVGAVVQ